MASFDKQKALDLLENNAQWIAVGAGGLFALWMAWGMIKSPAAVEIGSEVVEPGGIAAKVTAAKEELSSFSAASVEFDPPRVDLMKEYRAHAAGGTTSPAQRFPLLPAYAFRMPLFAIEQPAGTIATNTEFTLPDAPNPGLVSAPEKIDPAKLVALTTGKSFVDPTPLQRGPNGEVIPPAPPPPLAPGQAAPPPPANARDVHWVRYTYSVGLSDLAFLFQQKNIPAGLDRSFFLRAELLRQDLLPSGEWSAEKVVPWIEWEPLNPLPLNGAEPERRDYYRWALGKQQPIVQPGFYTLLAGDNPAFKVIGEAPLGLANFNPANFAGDESLLSPDQLRQLREYRAAEAKRKEEERRRNRPPPRPGGRPGGRGPGGMPGGGGGGGEFGPMLQPALPPTPSDGSVPSTGDVTPFQSRAFPPPDLSGEGEFGPPAGTTPHPAAGPTLEPLPATPLPPAPFNILQVGQGASIVHGWCYDETVKPGQTYRYRVRYYLANPLRLVRLPGAAQPGAAGPAAAQQQPFFAMVGEDVSGWSDSVTIPAVTNFFVPEAGINYASNTVKLTLFRWQNGKLHRTVDTYSPGDMIGKLDAASKIDYRSGWAVVDVRGENNSSAYVLLMGPDGRLERRTAAGDAASEKRIRLENEFLNPPPPPGTPPAMPGYPGGMPPGMGGGEFGPPGGFIPPGDRP